MVWKTNIQLLFLLLVMFAVLAANANANSPIVVNFDDLHPTPSSGVTLSGTNYAGLTWEWGNNLGGGVGTWMVPSLSDTSYPHSQPYCVTNGWGASLMPISFPTAVNVSGAYFSGFGTLETSGVRVHGYLNGVEVETTDWFNSISTTPNYFAMNLTGVDRIVVESIPKSSPGYAPASWYDMDDLTYTDVPEPMSILLLGIGAMLLRRNRR